MNSSRLVSVVIPTHNRAKFIERAILSVANQTLKNNEIIIVDDGSNDNTEEIIQNIKTEYPTLQLVYKKLEINHGAQTARNEGIKLALGEWISFLDSDDEWDTFKLQKQIDYALKKRYKVVYCDGYVVKSEKSKLRMNVRSVEGSSLALLLKKAGPTFPTLLVNRTCFDKVGLLDENIKAHQEWDFSIQLARHYDFGFIDEPLFTWYYDGHEAISLNKRRGAEGYAQIIEKNKKDILKVHGQSVLRNHYMEIASAFYFSKDYKKAKDFYKLAFNHSSNKLDKIISLIQSNTFMMNFINPRYWNISKIKTKVINNNE